MNGKAWLAWLNTTEWCRNNPTKWAAIVTPHGIYEIKFIPLKKEPEFKTEHIVYEESK